MSGSVVALLIVAAGLGLIVVMLARLVAVLNAAEFTLRSLVTGVRAVRRSADGMLPAAARVGDGVRGGEAALARLETLKVKQASSD
jgi:hypothetical protein